MSAGAEKTLVTLEVSFGDAPAESMVTPLCQSLFELCRPVLEDEDAASRLRLTAHELMENVVKYSAESPCELRFRLCQSQGGRLVARVQTRNVPRAENRADAAERLTALNDAGDPLAHYDSIIAHSARQPAGSGLGLARIHAETEYRLRHAFEGDALLIYAEGEVALKKGSAP